MSRIFWTTELVTTEAAKYSTRKEFKTSARGAFNYAYTNGLLPMLFPVPKRKVWSKELVIIASEKYANRNRFKIAEPSAYQYAYNNGFLHELFPNISFRSWNQDLVTKEAAKYSTRNEFRNGSPGAFKHAINNNLLDNLMPKEFPVLWDIHNKTGIYILYFKDEIVYIGKSTTDIRGRILHHNKDKCFDTAEVYVIENLTDINIIEVYLIGKHQPTYNIDCVNSIPPSVELVYLDNSIQSKHKFNIQELLNAKN